MASGSNGTLPDAPTHVEETTASFQGEVNCILNKNCGDCTYESKCVWCQALNQCVEGTFLGVAKEALDGNATSLCPDWEWKQCVMNGEYLQYTVIGAAALVLLILVACICRCVCFRKSRKPSGRQMEKFAKRDATDDRESLIPKNHNSKSAERRAALRAKWGIETADE
jgi:hypothetical protein